VSSLLDVLHKRPPRGQPVAAGPAPAAPSTEPPAAELGLAPEPDLALAGATTTLRGVTPPADDGATVEMPAPGAAARAGAGPERRWTDAAGLAGGAPAAVAAPDPAVTARPAARPRRLPLVLLACALVVGAAGYLALQLATPADEGFLAAPPADAPPPDATQAPPPAPQATASLRKKQRARPVQADPPDAAATDEGLAWYDQPALPAEALALPATPVILVASSSAADPVFETVREAYAALLAGDAARAESLYREALAADAGNVDALLGLGALAVRGGRTEEARDLYRRVQGLDPRNATAAAALSALPGTAAAETATESQLRTLLREQPGSAALHFALGLRHVAEGRWPDAQMAFFEAVRHEPTNADYAFNLAVSLDRLGQAGPAASYYRRALELATGSQQFDASAAGARLATLQGAGG
jgi:Flp pilus assembly protein TadD